MSSEVSSVIVDLNFMINERDKEILQFNTDITSASKNVKELKKQLRAKVITSIFLGVMATLSVGMVPLGGITAATIIGLSIEFAGVSLTVIFAIVCIVIVISLVMAIIFWITFGRMVSKAKGNKESFIGAEKLVKTLEEKKGYKVRAKADTERAKKLVARYKELREEFEEVKKQSEETVLEKEAKLKNLNELDSGATKLEANIEQLDGGGKKNVILGFYQKLSNEICDYKKDFCERNEEEKSEKGEKPPPIPNRGKRKVPQKTDKKEKESPETENEKLKRLAQERKDEIDEHKVNYSNLVHELQKKKKLQNKASAALDKIKEYQEQFENFKKVEFEYAKKQKTSKELRELEVKLKELRKSVEETVEVLKKETGRAFFGNLSFNIEIFINNEVTTAISEKEPLVNIFN